MKCNAAPGPASPAISGAGLQRAAGDLRPGWIRNRNRHCHPWESTPVDEIVIHFQGEGGDAVSEQLDRKALREGCLPRGGWASDQDSPDLSAVSGDCAASPRRAAHEKLPKPG